jgi:hypothetical protein
LITSLGFSMPLNSRRFVEEGLLNVNVEFFSVVILCFDIPRHFLIINNEFAGRASNSSLLIIKVVCGRGSRVEKVIWIAFCLGESVLISKLDISFISFYTISPCLGVRVLKFSDSILLIWI